MNTGYSLKHSIDIINKRGAKEVTPMIIGNYGKNKNKNKKDSLNIENLIFLIQMILYWCGHGDIIIKLLLRYKECQKIL